MKEMSAAAQRGSLGGPDTERPITVNDWLKEHKHDQKPAEVWREILGQLRQLSSDVWNGVRFFVTANGVILGATFTLAKEKDPGYLTAALMIVLVVLGALFTLAARAILAKQRDYYLKVLAQKVLFEKAVGLYDVALSPDLNLSLPWSVDRANLAEIESGYAQWRDKRMRAKDTITRYLFLTYEGMLVIYLVVFLSVAVALYKGAFKHAQPVSEPQSRPTAAAPDGGRAPNR
jgi:hypothetical protein